MPKIQVNKIIPSVCNTSVTEYITVSDSAIVSLIDFQVRKRAYGVYTYIQLYSNEKAKLFLVFSFR